MNFCKRVKVQMRTGRGSQMLEMMCGLTMCIIVVLILFDLTVLYSAYFTTDSICREAAIAAASGPPSALDLDAPKERAEAVIRKYGSASAFNQTLPTCLVQESITQPLPSPPYGGAVFGQVTVEVTATINIPFVLQMFSNKLSLVSRNTYPYTYTVPATAGQ